MHDLWYLLIHQIVIASLVLWTLLSETTVGRAIVKVGFASHLNFVARVNITLFN